MTPQTPAEGIMKTSEYTDSSAFHVECSCTDPDHAVQAWIEIVAEDDLEEITITFYTTQSYAGWKSVWERVKDAASILAGKELDRQHSLLLTKQAGLNVAQTINDEIKRLEENKG